MHITRLTTNKTNKTMKKITLNFIAIADNLQEGYPVELTTTDGIIIKLTQEGDDDPRQFKSKQGGRTMSFSLYDSMTDYLQNFTFTNIKY